MVKAVFAVTDEGDEEAVPLIDMTKVTRSTLADKALIQPRDGAVQRRLEQRQIVWFCYRASKPNRIKIGLLLTVLLSQSRF